MKNRDCPKHGEALKDIPVDEPGHTALWHTMLGTTECQAKGNCSCHEFRVPAGATPNTRHALPEDEEVLAQVVIRDGKVLVEKPFSEATERPARVGETEPPATAPDVAVRIVQRVLAGVRLGVPVVEMNRAVTEMLAAAPLRVGPLDRRNATHEEFIQSATRVLAKHRPSLEKLAHGPELIQGLEDAVAGRITPLEDVPVLRVGQREEGQQCESRSPDGDGPTQRAIRDEPGLPSTRAEAGSEPADSHQHNGAALPPASDPLDLEPIRQRWTFARTSRPKGSGLGFGQACEDVAQLIAEVEALRRSAAARSPETEKP